MKALSLRQPFAELVVIGRKTIELRKWNTKFRGEFLVHASKYEPDVLELEKFGLSDTKLSFGALVGTVELVDVKDYEKTKNEVDSEWFHDMDKHLADSNYLTSTKGFILKNAFKFPFPIPYRGQLQFFDVDYTIEQLGVVK